VNVQKIASYIQQRAAESPDATPLQFIVISLKDAFFSHSDALIGIYRDSASECSKSLTLDLTKYAHAGTAAEEGEDEDEEEEEGGGSEAATQA
jgi:structural maintenance of chromosome 1